MTRDAVIRYRLILSRKNANFTDFKAFRTSLSNGFFRYIPFVDLAPEKRRRLKLWMTTKSGTVKTPTICQKYAEILYQFLKRNVIVLAALLFSVWKVFSCEITILSCRPLQIKIKIS